MGRTQLLYSVGECGEKPSTQDGVYTGGACGGSGGDGDIGCALQLVYQLQPNI